jgi:ADP-heptose:LPS heptosyltransferase
MLGNFACFARALRLPDPSDRTTLVLTEGEGAQAASFLEEHRIAAGRPWLAMQPGIRDVNPPWGTEKFVVVARRFCERHGFPVLVFQGPSDVTPIARDVCAALGRGALLVRPMAIRRWAAVLERCSLALTSEGGTGHVAAALGVRTLVVSTTPNTSYWRRVPCVRGLSAAEVFEAAESLLSQRRVGGS